MKWWPKLTGLEEAEQAAHQSAGVCFTIAALTALLAGMSLWLRKPVLGIDSWAFTDAIIFAIAGWRVWRLSRTWAVLALVLYILERVYAFASSPAPFVGGFIGVAFTLLLISGVRGTFAYWSFKKKEPAGAFEAAAGAK